MVDITAKTKEDWIRTCKRCDCTDEEIQELLDERGSLANEDGYWASWSEMPVPRIGMKGRTYKVNDEGLWYDEEFDYSYETLGIPTP